MQTNDTSDTLSRMEIVTGYLTQLTEAMSDCLQLVAESRDHDAARKSANEGLTFSFMASEYVTEASKLVQALHQPDTRAPQTS